MRRMFDRKNLSYKLFNNDIEHLPTDLINELKVGDMLVKEEHNYIVTYKGDTGICMTYHDASCVETVSYDLIGGVWTFNSKDIQSIVPYMENIVDNQFNKRFIEGSTNIETIPGVTNVYNKWSLSGTHLMLVVSCTVDNSTVITSGTTLIKFNLPEWIVDKIDVLVGNRVNSAVNDSYNLSGTTTQNIASVLRKIDNNILITLNAYTATDDRIFRIQFDLLIDSE